MKLCTYPHYIKPCIYRTKYIYTATGIYRTRYIPDQVYTELGMCTEPHKVTTKVQCVITTASKDIGTQSNTGGTTMCD